MGIKVNNEIKVTLEKGKRCWSFLERLLGKGRDDIKPILGLKDCNVYLVFFTRDGDWINTYYYGNPTNYERDGNYTRFTIRDYCHYKYLIVLDNPGLLSGVKIEISGKKYYIKNPKSQIILRNIYSYAPDIVDFPEINPEFPDTVHSYLRKWKIEHEN